jgi:hypothetical protein
MTDKRSRKDLIMKRNKIDVVLSVIVVTALLLPNTAFGKPEATVFVTNYLQRSSTSTEPVAGQIIDKLSVFAAPGEYEPVSVSIRADVKLTGLRTSLAGALKNQSGDTIPASAVDIRLVDPFESWTKNKIECYLLSKSSVDVPAGTTRRFWITIHVPADTKPGLYRSRILIDKKTTRLGPDLGRLSTLKDLAYEVNVLPIKLVSAKETGMAFFMYNDTVYYPEDLVTEEYQTKIFEDMREHGMTTVTPHLYPVVDDKFTLTGSEKTHLGFSQTMDMLKKTDLIAPGVPVIWVGAECYGPDVWKGILDEGRKKNWPEIVFYALDEPDDSERAKLVRGFMEGFNAFRDKNPQYDLRVTTALGSSRGIQVVGHYYDLWIGCMAQRIGESGVIADAKMQKKELWTYDCMQAPVDAEMDRYYYGIWAWVAGAKGCGHWAYYCQPHLSYVYPTKNELIPSIGWEGVREGVDDYRYLATLRQLAEKARSSGKAGLAKGADKIFDEVKEMVTMDNYGKAYHEAAKLKTAEENTAYHRPRVEPNLSIDAYDKMRLKVAKEIENIAAALSES